MNRVLPAVIPIVIGLCSACAQRSSSEPETARTPPEAATKPAEDTTEPTEAAESRETELIALKRVTITQQGRPIARMFADGRTQGTEPDDTGKPGTWVPGPTLHADGTITLTKAGFRARLEDDGELYVVSPPGQTPREQLFGRISGNELSFATSESSWAVRIEGDTIEFNGPGFSNKIEGSVDEATRHTALVMTAAFFIDMSIVGTRP